MGQGEFHFTYKIHQDKKSLSSQDQAILEAATKAIESAYAPYSSFRVGVAICTSDNEVVTGSNQENCAFPVGQCAERVALYNLIHTLGRKQIDTLGIVADHVQQAKPASPCGSCRQMLSEYRYKQQHPIRLLLGTKNNELIYEIEDVSYLLPLSFEGFFLGQ